MKASSKLMKPFSVTGLSLFMALGGVMVPATAQDAASPSGGAFAPQTTNPPAAVIDDQAVPRLPVSQDVQQILLQARQELAKGAFQNAEQLIQPLGENPEAKAVHALIQRHVALMNSGSAPDYNKNAASFLLQQAEELANLGDTATAEALVNSTRAFQVQFSADERTPDSVMAVVQRLKAQSMAAAPVTESQATAARFLSQAQLAYDQGKIELAADMLDKIRSLNVPDSTWDQAQIRPWELELKVRDARSVAGAGVEDSMIQQATYHPESDTTRNVQVAGSEPSGDDNENAVRAMQLYDSGISALKNNDKEGALEYFRMAWQYRDQLDITTLQDLQSKLSQLQMTPFRNASTETRGVDEQLRAEMFQDVLRQRAIAEKMVEQRNPRGALNHLRMTRDKVEQSALDEASKKQLIAAVEREIAEMDDFIQMNIAEIENDEENLANRQAVDMDRANRAAVEQKIQSLLNDWNMLMDEQRWAEAEILARQAWELDSNNEAVVLMVEKTRLQGNALRAEEIERLKARSNEEFWRTEAEDMIMSVRPDAPVEWSDSYSWDKVRNREQFGMGGYGSEQERLIWSALKNQRISARFENTPLREAMQTLSDKAGVNIVFDDRALELESVSIDTPVNKDISQPITIESALNIILGSTGLVFKVEDEVIKITNKAALQASPEEKVWYVGDLVVPVPDYSGNMLNMQFITPQNPSQQYANGNGGLASNVQAGATVPVNMMQQIPNGQLNGFGNGSAVWSGNVMPQAPSPIYSTWGAKDVAQGGITEADFNDLIELIQETIDPDSWEENGGTGRMRAFPSTLSLIVTTTQENQDRIQDLLTRLRELNDVQIVVEVRFIRLRDDFFERIGIDFDFQINDGTGLTNQAQIPDVFGAVGNSGSIVGRAPISNTFIATSNLDIPVTLDTFGASAPQFGGFGADTALNFGFAILSDIEVFFLLQAAKGDQRSNVTQAPTVTMFNGQSASVFDGEQRPFVTSITPIVGDFAAAQQPVITILPEGTQLNVRATVSGDRRFVKMTLVPFFSQITAVDTFQFAGERRVRRGGGTDLQDILDAITGGGNDDPLGNDELEIVESGTTVQLPTFANTTVTTTVSVPDGGTVLLGGIKSMSEGRTERGVPFLSNIPYVNRLFNNVGIGRETNSLMMMVTPRIIIQEEEEQDQVGTGN